MFGRKKKKVQEEELGAPEQKIGRPADARVFGENLGAAWFAVTGMNPAEIIPRVVTTVLAEGGTRPSWRWQRNGREYVFTAWPADQPIRAGVLLAGAQGGRLEPVEAVPLLEGLPNDFLINTTRERPGGMGADVAVDMMEGKKPMWFFDPFYQRDRDDLTSGVTQTFWLGALAYGLREALLDEIAITNGPRFEAWAQKWLEENPGRKRMDVPPLKINIEDMPLIMRGRVYGEYELRGVVEDIQDCQLAKMPMKILYLNFPFENRPDMRLPLFASRHVLGKYEPEKGDEIETYAWFQGRIIDLEESPKE